MSGNFINAQSQQFVLNVFDYFTKEKDNLGSLQDVRAVKQRVCEALQISLPTVNKIVQARNDNRPLQRKAKKPRKSIKTRDMPEEVKMEVRNVLYSMYADKKPISLTTLQQNLKVKYVLDASTTTICTLLKQLGFKYKKDCNRRALCEKPSVASARVTFLKEYISNMNSSFPLPVVFLDETWIFAKGGTKRSWQDNSVKSVKQPNASSQGKRYIVLHSGNSEGFIENCSCIFSAKSKSFDYHDNMDGEKFEKWLKEQLLPNLIEPSLIVLDNAPYHCRLVNKIPNSSWRKDELRDWLANQHIQFSPTDLKLHLLNLAKQHQISKQYVVDNMIYEYGHQILRLPPYHCQFNAIENIWGIAKSYYDKHIGRNGYGEENVLAMWEESLQQCNSAIWKKTIEKTEKTISEWWSREIILDDIQPLIISGNADSDSDEDVFDQL